MAYAIDSPEDWPYNGQKQIYVPYITDLEGNPISDGDVLANSLSCTVRYYYDDRPDHYYTEDEYDCTNAGSYNCIVIFTITDPAHYRFYDDENPGTGYDEELKNLTTYSETRRWMITPLTLTVTAEEQFKHVGQPDPVLESYYSGNLSGETPGFSGGITREPGEAVGTYAITQGSLQLADNPDGNFLASNYIMVFVPNSLMIMATPIIPGGAP